MTVLNQPLELIHKSRNSLIYYQSENEFEEPVIIKVLNADYPSPHQLVRFNNEYEFTRNLNIEGVRKAISQTRLEDKPALMLEYVEGQTIKQAFAARQPLVDFLQIAISIAHALGELHQHQIIHRDVNSHNILLNLETKQVKLIDFGLASQIDLRIQHLGNPESLTGTLAYISPEQTGRMNRVVDYRTDLYSLGVTFFEMLTGHVPFELRDPLALVHAHLAKVPPSVTTLNPNVPSVLSDIVAKLLAKNAEDRYQSAFGLQADLERCLANLKDSPTFDSGFELGSEDFSGQLRIPQKLYGRSEEIERILDSFENVTAGQQELILVAGHPGVGKSALVAEIHKSITEKHGYFISGKFDQYQQNTPYAAFTQAFNQFADLLLTERETTLQRWQTRILAAVGNNGIVLTEVMPNLEKVIGPQPPVLKLDGQENRNRFNLTFQNLVQAISTNEHPLVVFIDDWQWTDLASLDLLKILMTDETNTHLLLIGAYRDNEVDGTHPFRLTLNELSAIETTIKDINLGNLQSGDVQQLVAESLRSSKDKTQALAGLVYEKTQGNAFFTHQFLQKLYEEGWLQFNFENRQWVWDIAQLEAQNITDNVVEFMAGKLKKLPPDAVRLLSLAACIGNQFDVQTLATIDQTSKPAALQWLSDALTEGLLIPLNEYYQLPEMADQAHFAFLHDRIQQAAYTQVPEADRPSIHLSIGRLLLANTVESELEPRLFDIVQHYNLAKTLITDDAEQLQIVALNMQAAELAAGAAAFKSAQTYLETAFALMPTNAWTSHYDQMLMLHSQLAPVLALTSDFDQLEQIFQVTKTQAHTTAEVAQVTQAKIQALMSQGNFPEILDIGIDFIEALGISFNRDPSANEAVQYLQETAEWLTDARIERIPRLPPAPPEEGVILQFALALYGPTFAANPPLFMILNSRLTRLIVEKGIAPEASAALINFGVLLCSVLHDVPKGRRLTTIVRDLVEEKFPADSLLSFVYTISNGFVVHRYDHLKNTLPLLAKGAQKGMASGNFEFASYAVWDIAWHQLFLGIPLDQVATASQQALNACQKMQRERVKDTCLLVHQAVLNLQGKSNLPWILKGDGYDEEVNAAFAFKGNDFAEVFRIFFYKGWLHYLFNYPQEAANFFQDAEPYFLHTAGMYISPLFYFYDSLANAAAYAHQNPEGHTQTLERINHNLEQFEVWVRFAPMNHQHKKDLMEAEKARLEGRYWEASSLYESAIQGAGENEFLHEEALANELCGKFWLDQGNNSVAQLYLQRAQNLYSLWGATAKVKQLEATYHTLFDHSHTIIATAEKTATTQTKLSTREITKSWLDIGSVLKANQTLSQTVQLNNLLTEMISILLENAGAERALILFQDKDSWFIEAEGKAKETGVETGLHLPLSEAEQLSMDVFNYVIHSGEAVVLANGAADPQFATDAYLTNREIKSVLCLPILHQGQLKLVLYLENNLTEGVFTEDRLELLKMLSVQMAISLENALLVDSLRTSIAERERAEENLRLTRFSVDSVADAVYWLDSEAGIVDVNQTACQMLGYTHAELTKLSVPDIDPEFTFERWPNTWAYIKKNGTLTIESVHRTKDGKNIPVELIANYIKFGDQELNCAIVRDITERKQIEQALKEKTDELDQFFTVTIDLLCIADTDGYFHRLNPQWEVVLGYSLPELEGRRFLDLVHPDDQASTLAALNDLGNHKAVMNFVNRYRCQDGSYRWIEWQAYPMENLVYAAARDVTKRRQIEDALRKSEERLSMIVEQVGGVLWTVDQELRFTSSQGAGLAALNLEPGQMVGTTLFEFFQTDDEEFESIVAHRHALQGESVIHEHAWGSFVFHTRLEPMRDEAGNILGVIGFSTDISKHKQVEEALRESEFFLQKSQSVAQIGSYYFDTQAGKWISSPALDDILGIDDSYPKNVEGWLALIHPEHKDEMSQHLVQHVLAEHKRFDKEYRIIRHDDKQERWIHGLGELEFDESGHSTKMIGTIQDITERRQIEEEIRRLNEDLEQRVIERTAQLEAANKELEAFSYSVSHDMRAPLRAIDGYTRILVEDYDSILDDEGKRVCTVIRNQTGKMSKLIDDLLTFSRLSRTEIRVSVVDMMALVESVFQELTTPELEESIDFQLNPIPSLVGDPALMRQVWVNLLSNAIKFSSKQEQPVIKVSSTQDAKEIIYLVQDNGAGFDMQYADKLFGVFQRLHSERDFEGTGVGLAIIQRIVHRHGGRVWAEAEVDKGATFFIALPQVEDIANR